MSEKTENQKQIKIPELLQQKLKELDQKGRKLQEQINPLQSQANVIRAEAKGVIESFLMLNEINSADQISFSKDFSALTIHQK